MSRNLLKVIAARFGKQNFTPLELGLAKYLENKYGLDVVIETINSTTTTKEIKMPVHYIKTILENKFLLEDLNGDKSVWRIDGH